MVCGIDAVTTFTASTARSGCAPPCAGLRRVAAATGAASAALPRNAMARRIAMNQRRRPRWRACGCDDCERFGVIATVRVGSSNWHVAAGHFRRRRRLSANAHYARAAAFPPSAGAANPGQLLESIRAVLEPGVPDDEQMLSRLSRSGLRLRLARCWRRRRRLPTPAGAQAYPSQAGQAGGAVSAGRLARHRRPPDRAEARPRCGASAWL